MQCMQKSLITILILVVNAATAKATANNALTYYRLINRAELAICHKNLTAAGKLYQQAFRVNPHKAAFNDLCNAFYCAMDRKRTTEARGYFKAMCNAGMPTHKLVEILAIYPGDSLKILGWKTKYPAPTGNRTFLADTIAALYKRDQGVRNYFLALHPNGNYMNDSVHAVDNANARQLYRLVKTYGLHACMSPANELKEQTTTLLLHHMQSCNKNVQPLFDTILYNGISSFDITPSFFELMINAAMDAYKDQCFRYKGVALKLPIRVVFGAYGFDREQEIWPKYLPAKEEMQINKERQKAGMASLADVREKTIFSKAAKKRNSSYAKYSLNVTGFYTDAQDETERNQMKKEYLKFKPVK